MPTFHRTPILKRRISSPHLTNAGQIIGVWIFHRHGDRCPNRYLGSPHHYEEECNHWFSRIPPSSARSGEGGGAFRELSRFYGVKVSETQNGGQFLDVGRAVSPLKYSFMIFSIYSRYHLTFIDRSYQYSNI